MNEKWSIGDGKNNAEWCVFKGGVCVASCSTEHGIFISEAQNIATKMNEIESMRQQLAAALAACKLKDEELEKIRGHIGLYNLFSCVGSDSYDPECADLNVGKCGEIATKALAIRPGTEALDKWIGEQSGWTHSCPVLCLDGVELWIDRCPHCGRPAPKGLK